MKRLGALILSLAFASSVRAATVDLGSSIGGSGGGGVTSVTASTPVSSSGGSTPNISLPASSTSVDGYLAATDFTALQQAQITVVDVVSASLTGTGLSAGGIAFPNVPLTGSTPLVIDGVTMNNAGPNRILLAGQTTATQNGIYIYADTGATYTLTPQASWASAAGFIPGRGIYVANTNAASAIQGMSLTLESYVAGVALFRTQGFRFSKYFSMSCVTADKCNLGNNTGYFGFANVHFLKDATGVQLANLHSRQLTGTNGSTTYLDWSGANLSTNTGILFGTGIAGSLATSATTGATASTAITLASGTTVNGNSGLTTVATGVPSGNGASGQLIVKTANTTGTGNSGPMSIITGSTSGAANTGNMLIHIGNASGSGNGGFMDLVAGNATGGGAGGSASYRAGASTGSNIGGALSLNAGGADAGNGGDFTGTSGPTNTGNSGAMTLLTADTSAGTGFTGDATLGTGNSIGGNSGNAILQVGTAAGTQGNIKLFKVGVPSIVGQAFVATGVDGSGYWSSVLNNSSGNPTVAWGSQILTDQVHGGNTAVNWSSRALDDASGVVAANWGGRILLDNVSLGVLSLDWTNRQLLASNGTTIQADWSNPSFLKIQSHEELTGTAPALGGDCGTGATIVGNDGAGRVVLGTGVTTTCTLTFASAWTNAPHCDADDETSPHQQYVNNAPSTALVVLSSTTFTAGDSVSYGCKGYQ